MIKVTISEKTQKLDFPMLMISTEGLIILAFHLDEVCNFLQGTVISSKNNNSTVGYYSNRWDNTGFRPYTGPVTLENQEDTHDR